MANNEPQVHVQEANPGEVIVNNDMAFIIKSGEDGLTGVRWTAFELAVRLDPQGPPTLFGVKMATPTPSHVTDVLTMLINTMRNPQAAKDQGDDDA